MDQKSIGKWKWIWSAILLTAWGIIAFILLKNQGNLSLETLLAYEPENRLLAILVMFGLFLLKSVDFIMHSGLLYAASGVMFPLPLALLINTVGVAMICISPYWIGRTLGAPLVEYLLEKHPKLRSVSELRLKNDFVVSLLFRISGLPLSVCSLYMGAMKFDFRKYLLGSVIGFFPVMADYTILGVAADDIHSPVFLIALGIKALLLLGSFLVYRHLLKKSRKQEAAAE